MLVLPVLILFLYVMVEGMFILRTWIILEHASNVGARYAAVGNTASAVTTCTVNESGSILSSSNVTVSGAQGTVGNPVTVSVSYTYTYESPLLTIVKSVTGTTIPNTVTMTPQTQMRLESQSAPISTQCGGSS